MPRERHQQQQQQHQQRHAEGIDKRKQQHKQTIRSHFGSVHCCAQAPVAMGWQPMAAAARARALAPEAAARSRGPAAAVRATAPEAAVRAPAPDAAAPDAGVTRCTSCGYSSSGVCYCSCDSVNVCDSSCTCALIQLMRRVHLLMLQLLKRRLRRPEPVAVYRFRTFRDERIGRLQALMYRGPVPVPAEESGLTSPPAPLPAERPARALRKRAPRLFPPRFPCAYGGVPLRPVPVPAPVAPAPVPVPCACTCICAVQP